jgi:bacteriorhodopsin
MYWFTGILGLAMAVAPFALGYSDNTFAMWTSVILGLAVLLASLFEALDERKAKWEWWVTGIAGILAVIAPFVFGFT